MPVFFVSLVGFILVFCTTCIEPFAIPDPMKVGSFLQARVCLTSRDYPVPLNVYYSSLHLVPFCNAIGNYLSSKFDCIFHLLNVASFSHLYKYGQSHSLNRVWFFSFIIKNLPTIYRAPRLNLPLHLVHLTPRFNLPIVVICYTTTACHVPLNF